MFVSPSILFLAYAVITTVLFVHFSRRFLKTCKAGPNTLQSSTHLAWMFGRGMFTIITFFLVWDNLRIFAGASWIDKLTAPAEGEHKLVPKDEVPAFAQIFDILVFSHLVLVPLTIWPLAEIGFTLPSYLSGQYIDDTCLIMILRIASIILAVGLAGLGFFNLLGEWSAIDTFGYEASNFRGIITYTTPNETMIFEEGNFQGIPGTALFGVIGMSLVSVVIGAVLWWKSGYKLFFIICVVCLLGQGAGPMILGSDFAFLSNFLEALLFIAIALVEFKYWSTQSTSSSDQLQISSDERKATFAMSHYTEVA